MATNFSKSVVEDAALHHALLPKLLSGEWHLPAEASAQACVPGATD